MNDAGRVAQCTAVVEVGGEVDSMLLEGSFLFVGLHQARLSHPPLAAVNPPEL